MQQRLPLARELFGKGPFAPPIEYVIERLDREGLFAPWVSLNEDGQISRRAVAPVLEAMYKRGEIPRMSEQPLNEEYPIHAVARSIGSNSYYGGWESRIDGGARLYGPLYLGRWCVVRSEARLGGPVLFDEEVRVGSSHLARVVVGPRTRIASNVTMGDSVIGGDCVIESGISVRSRIGLRGSQGTILTRMFHDSGWSEVDTCRKVFGIVCGYGCTIEATVEPGCVFLPGCHVRSWMTGLPAAIYSPRMLDVYHERWLSHTLHELHIPIKRDPD